MEVRCDANTGAGVTLAATAGADEVFEPGDVGIVEFDNMRFYGDAAGEGGQLDMQAWVSADSHDVVFAYEPVAFGVLDRVREPDAAAAAWDRRIADQLVAAVESGDAEHGVAAFFEAWSQV